MAIQKGEEELEDVQHFKKQVQQDDSQSGVEKGNAGVVSGEAEKEVQNAPEEE